MKIKSIDIASFGKFKNYHLDLSDSLTVIFGENEKGKSTIMAFIRMMFYGNSGKASGIDKNLRKKYRPWNSDLMAGSITFESEGVTYRLEREFKASNSTDKISLINLDTNEKQALSSGEDIGARFFGLTDSAFERSVFISESRFASKNDAADGEINARLSNIATTSDDDVSFEKIYLRLRCAKEELISKSRKIGKLDKAEAELGDLDKTITDAKATEQTVISLKESAVLKEEEIAQSSAMASELFEQLKNSDKIKKKNFLTRYISAEKERAEAKERLSLVGGGYADRNYADSLRALLDRLCDLEAKTRELKETTESKKSEISSLEASLSALLDEIPSDMTALEEKRVETEGKIEDIRAQNDELKSKIDGLVPTKKINIALLVMGLVLAAGGSASYFILNFISYIGLIAPFIFALGLIIFILSFVLRVRVMPDTSEFAAQINDNSATLDALLKEKESTLEEISRIKGENSERDIKTASQSALLESKKADLEALAEDLSGQMAEKESVSESIEGLTDNLKHIDNKASADALKNLEDAIGYLDMISQKITVLADNAACSSLAEAEEKLAALCKNGKIIDLTEAEIDSLKERFKAQTDKTSHLKSELAAINEKIKSVTASTPPVAVLDRNRAQLAEKIKGYEDFAATADLALSALDAAFRDLRKNYSEVLDQRTGEIFTRLVGDKYLTVSVSKSMELGVTTTEAFGTKESEYLSLGTEEQLYLAMRLAISELIANEGEKLPIFADDPLSQYDDCRSERALAFLKDYSRDKQMVLFTCHSFIKETAEKQGIKTLEM